jgi:hypothetical protein
LPCSKHDDTAGNTAATPQRSAVVMEVEQEPIATEAALAPAEPAEPTEDADRDRDRDRDRALIRAHLDTLADIGSVTRTAVLESLAEIHSRDFDLALVVCGIGEFIQAQNAAMTAAAAAEEEKKTAAAEEKAAVEEEKAAKAEEKAEAKVAAKVAKAAAKAAAAAAAAEAASEESGEEAAQEAAQEEADPMEFPAAWQERFGEVVWVRTNKKWPW